MLPFASILKWKHSNVCYRSYSLLIDTHQIYVRNIYLFCFALSMTRHIFGENIICQLDGNKLSQIMLDTKCFVNGTFTNLTHTKNPVMPILYHDYYQWVPIVLLLLAFSFYFPYRIWSSYVSGFIKEITTDIKSAEDCYKIFQVIHDSKGDGLYWKTLALECWYVIQLSIQIFIIDVFFNRMLSLSSWSWKIIPILFPEMASCFYDYYSGGGMTTGRFRCLLPLNSVYRKIFVVLYWAMAGLLVLHGLFLIYRIMLVIVLGLKTINVWWCVQIAQSQANSWHAKRILKEQWKNPKLALTKKENEYVCMEKVN